MRAPKVEDLRALVPRRREDAILFVMCDMEVLGGGVVVKDGSTGGSSQKAVISSPSRTRGTSPAVAPIGDPSGPDVIYRRKFTEGHAVGDHRGE